MKNVRLDIDEQALLVRALKGFILLNTPYTKSGYATGKDGTNLLVATRVLAKVEGETK